MKTRKRVLAIILVVLLILIYLVTLISAIVDSPYSEALFKASMFCTFAVPIFIYAVMLIHRLTKDKNEDSDEED